VAHRHLAALPLGGWSLGRGAGVITGRETFVASLAFGLRLAEGGLGAGSAGRLAAGCARTPGGISGIVERPVAARFTADGLSSCVGKWRAAVAMHARSLRLWRCSARP
jgi:hypothetical protein